MKAIWIVFCCALTVQLVVAQKKPNTVDKAPPQKEMKELMKEAQGMLDELSPEDKKMMDSLGIKMPSFKNIPHVSNQQLAEAWDNESLVVPKKDMARINTIPKGLTNTKTGAYISSIQNKTTAQLKSGVKDMADKIYSYIKSNSKNNSEAGNMAMAFWIDGKPEMALYILGRICIDDSSNTDNLSNYASMLSMLGGQHLAIPILSNLNTKFPKNSTLLNNLGQAWFGLGDIPKAEEYLDSAITIFPYHPQANMTKGAIEESRGNIEKARESVKKSIKQAYTKEKEEKLRNLGYKISGGDFRMPRQNKADPMNLGGFRAPAFPLSVDVCILAEKEWKDFFQQIDDKISQLRKQRELVYQAAIKSQQQRIGTDMAMIKTSLVNSGMKGQLTSVPIYANRASIKLKSYTDLYSKKLEKYLTNASAFMVGEGKMLTETYNRDLSNYQKEYEAQSAMSDPCPKKKSIANNYLKAINPKLEELYTGSLQLQKEFLNESAYWNLYIQWPDMYEAVKLDFQMQWLSTIKKGLGVSGYGSGYPFASVTLFACEEKEEKHQKNTLQKFDDIACQYNDTLDLKVIEFTTNCSRMTSKLNLKFVEYTRYDDFERAEDDTYVGSTINVSIEKGVDWKKGPVKVEVKAGAGVQIEMGQEGLEDVILIGEVKAGAGHTIFDPIENDPNPGLDAGMGGKDVIDTTLEIGFEGRISIISGRGSVSGTGVLENIILTQW